MFRNLTTIIKFNHRIILFTLISIFCYLTPIAAQDSTNTETPPEPEPIEQPATTNPTPVEETTNNNSNPTTTTAEPSSTNTPISTPTNTPTTPVVTNPSSSNTTPNNNRTTPTPTPNNDNNTTNTVSTPSNYNPFELIKDGRSFEKDIAVLGQEIVNPTPRRNTTDTDDSEEEEVEETSADEAPIHSSGQPQNVEVDPNNPFELVKNGNIAVYETVSSSKKSTSNQKTSSNKKPTKERKPIIDGSKLNYEAIVKFLGLLIVIGFLSFLTTSFRSDLQKISRAFSNSNMMTQLQREKGSLLNMPYIPLYILFALTGGTFLYLVVDYFEMPMLENQGLSLLLCILGLGGFYFFKHLLLKLISVIFPFKKEINQYHFLVGIFNQVIGLALIPMVMLIAFAPQNIKLFAIYGAFAIVGLILLNRLLRSFVIVSKFIAFHKFHLIVYICAVEIAPFFIIIKLLMS